MLNVTKVILENQNRWKTAAKIGAGALALGGAAYGGYRMYKGDDKQSSTSINTDPTIQSNTTTTSLEDFLKRKEEMRMNPQQMQLEKELEVKRSQVGKLHGEKQSLEDRLQKNPTDSVLLSQLENLNNKINTLDQEISTLHSQFKK